MSTGAHRRVLCSDEQRDATRHVPNRSQPHRRAAEAVDKVRIVQIPLAWSRSPEDLVGAAIFLASRGFDSSTGSPRPLHGRQEIGSLPSSSIVSVFCGQSHLPTPTQ